MNCALCARARLEITVLLLAIGGGLGGGSGGGSSSSSSGVVVLCAAALVLGHDFGVADRPGAGRAHDHGAQVGYAHAAAQLAEEAPE